MQSQDWAGLSGCSRQLRDVVHTSVKAITVNTDEDVAAVLKGNWSNLSLIKMQPAPLTDIGSIVHRPNGSNFEISASFHAKYSRQHANPLLRLRSLTERSAYIVKATAQQSQLNNSQLHRPFVAAFSNLHKGWGQTDSLLINISCHADQLIEDLTVYDWPNVKRLVLANNQLGSSAVEHLARGSWPQLEQLDLSRNQLDKAAMIALLHGSWPSLVELSLDANPALDASAISVIAQAPSWTALSSLSLSRIKISSGSARSILLMHRCLKSLDLSYTKIDVAGLSELFAKPWSQLHTLELEGNSLQADVIATLLSVSLICQSLSVNYRFILFLVALPKLKVLRLSGNRLDADAARLVARGKWPQLQHLALNRNNLDTAAMAFLAKGKWPALSILDLDSNDIGTLGLELLMAGQWPQLCHLTLGFSSVTEANWSLLNHAPTSMTGSKNKLVNFTASRRLTSLTSHECVWPKLQGVLFMQSITWAPRFAAASVYQEQENKVKSVATNTEFITRPDAPTGIRVPGCGGPVARTSSHLATAKDKSKPTGIKVVGWCTVACLSMWCVKEVCRYTRGKRLLTSVVNFFRSELICVYSAWRDRLCAVPRCKDTFTE